MAMPNMKDMRVASSSSGKGEGSNGRQTWWNGVTRGDYTVIRSAWLDAGLEEKLLPEPMDAEVALRAALRSVGQTKAKVVKRPNKQGWVLVDLKQFDGRDLPVANNRIIARLVGEEMVLTDENGRPSTDTDCERIVGEFRSLRRELTSQQISAWLTELVEGVNGVRLRDGGGLYWVPKSQCDRWLKFCGAIADGTGARFCNWRTYGTDEEIRADVAAALEAEGEAIGKRMMDEFRAVAEGLEKLGPDGMETRRAIIGAYLEKLMVYKAEVCDPTTRTMALISRLNTNMATMMRFADGVAAGRNMAAPVLLELDETVAKPKTAAEVEAELAEDAGVKRFAGLEIDAAEDLAEVSGEIETPAAIAPPVPVAPPAPTPVQRRRFAPPTPAKPAVVEEPDAATARFGLIELD